jgi:hypothetical protein
MMKPAKLERFYGDNVISDEESWRIMKNHEDKNHEDKNHENISSLF